MCSVKPVLRAERRPRPDEHLDAGGQAHAGGRLEGAKDAFDVSAPDDTSGLGQESSAGVAFGELEVNVRIPVCAYDFGRGPDALAEHMLDRGGDAGKQGRERNSLGFRRELLAHEGRGVDRQPTREGLEVAAYRDEPLARFAVPAGTLCLGFGLLVEGYVEVGCHKRAWVRLSGRRRATSVSGATRSMSEGLRNRRDAIGVRIAGKVLNPSSSGLVAPRRALRLAFGVEIPSKQARSSWISLRFA